MSACQTSVWYPIFSRKQTYATRIIQLGLEDEAFITSDAISATHVERAVRSPSLFERSGFTRALCSARGVPAGG